MGPPWAAVAGTWYPGRRWPSLRRWRGTWPPPGGCGPKDAWSPSSAPTPASYSGPVAAYGYSLLRGRQGVTAVLVGPSHRARFDGVSASRRGRVRDAAGAVPVDEDWPGALAEATRASRPSRGPREEHSLEMQLPFLQHLVPGLRVVPVLMGRQSREEVEVLARALAQVLAKRDALLVASSDLSHYHPAPVARELDAEVTGYVARFDPEGLMDRLETSRGHACGGGPIVAVMKAARALGADRSSVLRYATSGDVGERDKSRVVAICPRPDRVVVGAPPLFPEERRRLLATAREALLGRFAGASAPRRRPGDLVRHHGGAFVTLRTRDGGLRGCVGVLESTIPCRGRGQAVAAACSDRRFDPLRADEVPGSSSRSRPSARAEGRPEGIEVGRDGLLVREGGTGRAPAPGGGRAPLGPRDVPGQDMRKGRALRGRLARTGGADPRLLGHRVARRMSRRGRAEHGGPERRDDAVLPLVHARRRLVLERAASHAEELAPAGITALWLPPAYKGAGGGHDVGYGVYDMYDLGEFDQKGSVRTKYGTQEQYRARGQGPAAGGVQVYADVVLNHRMGGDAVETARATPFSQDDRLRPKGEPRDIQAYTHFHFPGRKRKYSAFEWHWRHFDAVDYDAPPRREEHRLSLRRQELRRPGGPGEGQLLLPDGLATSTSRARRSDAR